MNEQPEHSSQLRDDARQIWQAAVAAAERPSERASVVAAVVDAECVSFGAAEQSAVDDTHAATGDDGSVCTAKWTAIESSVDATDQPPEHAAVGSAQRSPVGAAEWSAVG